MEDCQSPERSPADDPSTGGSPSQVAGAEEEFRDASGEDPSVVDISRKDWEISLFDPPLASDDSADDLYVYRNTFSLVPESVGRFGKLKTFKFFANDVTVLPPQAGNLVNLEKLQVKVSFPELSGVSIQKMNSLKELELSRVPMRPSAQSLLSDISGLKCLTRLSICHFSIRYLPPEIRCLEKLEELDLSFNKLKSLPSDIAMLSALKSLRVANNKLTDLPPGISSLRRLEKLDLSNNRLTSLMSIDLGLMYTLQYLDIKHNKIVCCCEIPSWICCDFEGNGEDIVSNEFAGSIIEVGANDVASHRFHGSRSCSGCQGSSSCLHPDALLSCRQRLKKVMKRRDYLQQRARQERLNLSRMWRGEDNPDRISTMMAEASNSSSSVVENENADVQYHFDDVQQLDDSAVSLELGSSIKNARDCCEDNEYRVFRNSSLTSCHHTDAENIVINEGSHDDCSCVTSDSSGLKEEYKSFNEIKDNTSTCCNKRKVPDESSSTETYKLYSKSKRHSDIDLYNPKPSKFHRPVIECSSMSCKYSIESFCSIDDHLPDGFYDAGRDRPFMSLQDYEQRLCLDSREVILLDREKDEELDAIAFSAQVLLSNWRRSCSSENEDYVVDNLQRASVLALFVSDCFGGSERSASVMRTRRAVAGSNKQQPYVCTCSAGSINDNGEVFKQAFGIAGGLSFVDLCEKSIRSIKGTLNSNVVPIGTLRFGVCRHRAVLMKYLCDRADPPIPCELVRGYLDFMPHAWNAILVRKDDAMIRMLVDACYPTDIREENDSEYFCRYIPLSRFRDTMATQASTVAGSFISSSTVRQGNRVKTCSVTHYKSGDLDAAVKVRNMEANGASEEEIRHFECFFLGEVRMLGALKKHSCIVEIYGHQLSAKWVPAGDGNNDSRLLQSVIIMEYVKGGSLKNYLNRLSKEGEKHVPVNVALCIARDVACALVEVHSKYIIHRDIKSENILVDMESSRPVDSPIVKLSDFDRSVPLYSSTHTCCIAHLGIHPPDVCVGTPRWMAPEIVLAMHQRNPYGLEVDIWSFGCLLLELLTLQIPYVGQSEAEIYDCLQRKQRPSLTPELEALMLSDELGSCSDAEADILKLLVDLFYRCTSGNPADRPTARCIYDMLCAISREADLGQVCSAD